MAKSSSQKPVDKLTYEEAFAELEGVVNSLEEEQNPLEDALSLFERGQALAERCSVLLDEAMVKVRELSGDDLVDFDYGE